MHWKLLAVACTNARECMWGLPVLRLLWSVTMSYEYTVASLAMMLATWAITAIKTLLNVWSGMLEFNNSDWVFGIGVCTCVQTFLCVIRLFDCSTWLFVWIWNNLIMDTGLHFLIKKHWKSLKNLIVKAHVVSSMTRSLPPESCSRHKAPELTGAML